MRRFDRALVAGLLLAIGTGGMALAQNAPAGDAANGKRLYLADGCYECHGRSGQGGSFNGPAPVLAQTGLPLDAFTQQLRDPSNDMPAYAEAVLPDKDLGDIYAFLHTLPGPRVAKDIAILNH
jgi:mono/diheme cytochrome c family protein